MSMDVKEACNISFGMAIGFVKDGYKIQRKGWNGKEQYVELATRLSYKNAAGEIINAEHLDVGSQALAFIGTRGVQVGWLASQSDMLANDWRAFK